MVGIHLFPQMALSPPFRSSYWLTCLINNRKSATIHLLQSIVLLSVVMRTTRRHTSQYHGSYEEEPADSRHCITNSAFTLWIVVLVNNRNRSAPTRTLTGIMIPAIYVFALCRSISRNHFMKYGNSITSRFAALPHYGRNIYIEHKRID